MIDPAAGKIPYYRVSKKGWAYWCPTRRMRDDGFAVQALGPDGAEAREKAELWNARWQVVRRERRVTLGVRRHERRERPSRATPANYVYFLRSGDRVKIGTSRTPASRLADLAIAVSDPVEQILVVRGSRADEKRLHKRFERFRTRGEWFSVSHALQLLITRCAAAGVVVHEPPHGTDEPHGVEAGKSGDGGSDTPKPLIDEEERDATPYLPDRTLGVESRQPKGGASA